jgi:hypothetical protein
MNEDADFQLRKACWVWHLPLMSLDLLDPTWPPPGEWVCLDAHEGLGKKPTARSYCDTIVGIHWSSSLDSMNEEGDVKTSIEHTEG